MAKVVQRRRGSTAEHGSFTGALAETTIDTTKNTVVVHDGTTAGGFPLAREDLTNVSTTSLTAITGSDTTSSDTFFIYDASASSIKSITRAELNNALVADDLDNVTITSGTIDGTIIGGTTPAAGTFTDLVVNGDLTVNGTTTTINTSELTVEDINITIASGAADAAAADGGGITVDGANATITYAASGDKWVMNKPLDLGSNDLSTSGTVSLTGGTANGVLYLNGSKAVSSGTDLVFDGTNFGIGVASPTSTLDVAGDITIADKIIHSGDANTSVRFPTLDTVTIETAAAERVRVTSTGDVGVGTSSPLTRLHVEGSVYISDANPFFYINDSDGKRYDLYSTANDFIIRDGTDDIKRIVLKSDGNVGFGTESPVSTVHVVGDLQADNININGNTLSSTDTDGNIILDPNGTGVVQEVVDGSPYNIVSQIDIGTDPNQIPLNQYLGNLAYQDADSIAGNVNIGGNVGIGTLTPTEKLDVVGNADISGTVTATTFIGDLTGNADTATVLETTRTLWGQSFDGSADVSGDLTNVGDITGASGIDLTATSGTLSLAATGANIITASTNGTERLRVDANGNISIGTTVNLGDTNNRLVSISGSGSATISTESGVIAGAFSASTNVGYVQFGSFTNHPVIIGVNNTEKMRLTTAGDFGIGTSTPASKLDVAGDITIADKIIHSGDTNTAIRFPAADTFTVETAGVERLRVNSNGIIVAENATISGKQIVIASGAANAAAANGAGILIDGANATINYEAATDALTVNKSFNIVTDTDEVGLSIFSSIGPNSSSVQILSDASGYGRMEFGGNSGAYLDFKTPASDDYDLRIIVDTTTNKIVTVGNLEINNISNGGTIISNNSTDAALRVTQIGTGNALVVEDSANPDSTPFVITSTGNVGISTTTPAAKLQVDQVGIETTTTSVTTTTQTSVYEYSTTEFRTAELICQIVDSTNSEYHSTKLFVIHDGTNAFFNQSSVIDTNGELGTFAVDIDSGNVRVLFTANASTTKEIKVAGIMLTA